MLKQIKFSSFVICGCYAVSIIDFHTFACKIPTNILVWFLFGSDEFLCLILGILYFNSQVCKCATFCQIKIIQPFLCNTV